MKRSSGAMAALIGFLFAWPFACAAAQEANEQKLDARTITSLDADWEFYPLPEFKAWPAEAQLSPEQIHQLSIPAAGPQWKPVHLPDDYVVRGTFSPEPNASLLADGAMCPLGGRECEPPGGEHTDGQPGALNRPGRNNYGGHGYLPLYPAWYQRTFFLPNSDANKSLWLNFGGVYRDAIVFVNGQFVAQHASGYTGFRVNISSAAKFGARNRVAVFVDPRWFEGWWYEGGGIYRHVRLIVTGKLHVSPWGTFVNAQVDGNIQHNDSGDSAAAQLKIETTIRNDDGNAKNFTLRSQMFDPRGRLVATESTNEELLPGQESTFEQQASLRDASLWSLDHPVLYRLKTTLRASSKTEDEQVTGFGIRSIRFDPNQGFFLNGKHVEIRGMCVHQDFPAVGIAAPDNLWRWRIEELRAMGTNAYRTAHNPVSKAFYDDADEMGMLVMAENRHLGDTYFPKTSGDTAYNDLEDLKSMVLQLRNHPSIIMWSLCNEEGEGKTPHGGDIFAAMKQAIEKIDPTRPVTAAINGGYTSVGIIPVEDILGMNYHNDAFAKIHGEFPKLMIYGSEDVNAKTSRGTLETSRSLGVCSENGCDANSDSGPWQSWAPVVENPYVAGEFVWTGFDYRGEPNPFSWPAVTSQTGAMDLAGFPKPVYYYWKAEWRPEPSVYFDPDWNLPEDQAGKEVLVRIFSNCDRIELLLNGKSLGTKDMPKDRYLDWQVPFAPGTLTSVGFKAGSAAARYSVRTAGPVSALRLSADVHRLRANSEDAVPIEARLVDAHGEVMSNADSEISFAVSGAGSLAGTANGDPTSHESNVGSERKAFHGLAMVLVRADEHPGAVTVEARAKGLAVARITIPVVAEGSGEPEQ